MTRKKNVALALNLKIQPIYGNGEAQLATDFFDFDVDKQRRDQACRQNAMRILTTQPCLSRPL